MNYESCTTIKSKCRPGVSFTIRKISFERRVELTRRLREVIQKVEFLEAGTDPRESIEAALLETEIDRSYLLWGLAEVRGLEVDGKPATPEILASAGPEDLAREIVAAIRAACGLTEAERKN
jgi:hypothetical protein